MKKLKKNEHEIWNNSFLDFWLKQIAGVYIRSFTKQCNDKLWQMEFCKEEAEEGTTKTNERTKKERVSMSLWLLLKDASIVSDLLLSCRKLTLESTHFLLLHPFKGMDLDEIDAKGMDGRRE